MSLFTLTTIAETKLVTGTQQLIGDFTSVLLVLAPLAGVAWIIYSLIRRGMADEQDQKRWNNHIKTALICMIGAVVASVVIKVILSYFE